MYCYFLRSGMGLLHVQHEEVPDDSPGRRVWWRTALHLGLLAFVATSAHADWSDILEDETGLIALEESSAAWADYDGDGDLDLAISGFTGDSLGTWVFRYDGGTTFTDIGLDTVGLQSGSVEWGDYDGDGDPDLLLTGDDGSLFHSLVLRNDGSDTFTDIGAGLSGVTSSDAMWGDLDGDGDLDILLSGWSGSAPGLTRIYRNDDGDTFAEVSGTGLPDWNDVDLDLGDFDFDGDLDIVMAGDDDVDRESRVFRNDGSFAFTDLGLLPYNVTRGAAEWGDADSDGDLDILLSGVDPQGFRRMALLENNGGQFTSARFETGGEFASANWGDVDNDGDLDFAFSFLSQVRGLHVRLNFGGFDFTNDDDLALSSGVSSNGAVAIGDYDADGDLDLLASGCRGGTTVRLTRVLRNDELDANMPPTTPANLQSRLENGQLTLSWNASTDPESPVPALTYNLRVGSTPGGNDVVPAHADPATGRRHIVNYGNRGRVRSWQKTAAAGDTLYWTVQAIDNGWTGSPFAPEVLVVATAVNLTSMPNPSVEGDPVTLTATLTPSSAGGTVDFFDEENFLGTADVQNGQAVLATTAIGLGERQLSAEYSSGGDVYSEAVALHTHIVEEDAVFTRRLETETGLAAVEQSSVAWGDYDADGDLDLALSGDTGSGLGSWLFRNDAGSFVEVSLPIPGLEEGSLDWGDYDGDGDLDLLATGDDNSLLYAIVLRNDGSDTFTDIEAPLAGVTRSDALWGDADGDGDLDILLSGWGGSAPGLTRIYRNDDGTFVEVSTTGLPDWNEVDLDWGDFDNDGDLDVLLAGDDELTRQSRLFRNEGDLVFADLGLLPFNVTRSGAEWGDADNDGDLDIFLIGHEPDGGERSALIPNDGGVFCCPIFLEGGQLASADWGDFDNDGELDLARSGIEQSTPALALLRQTSPFAFEPSLLTGLYHGEVAWGDYDADGDLDLLASGRQDGGTPQLTWLYENEVEVPNTPPASPSNLTSLMTDGVLTLSWDPGSDDATPEAGLSYNLRVGSTPDGHEIVPAHADPATGRRQVVGFGNRNRVRSWPSSVAPGDTLYWSVQTIDNGWSGSAFAPEVLVVATALELSSAPNPSPPGDDVTLTATLDPATAAGSVEFFDDDTSLGVAPIESGTAVLVVPAFAGGDHELTASYAGEGLYSAARDDHVHTVLEPSSVDDPFADGTPGSGELPSRLRLHPGSPSPFVDEVVLLFDLPADGRVQISIHDVHGRRLTVLHDEATDAGRHQVAWKGREEDGRSAAPGVYFVRLDGLGQSDTERIVLLR